MSKDWKTYQEDVARFFRTLGLIALVEENVEGVRGSHNIDVFVKGSYQGINFKWVVECKAWKTNIPKEKVLTLISIVQDLGADRGFLLSEKGFQSGAIRLTKNTNITLSSLNDLIENINEDIIEATLSKLSWKAKKIVDKLRTLKDRELEYSSLEYNYIREIGSLLFLDFAFGKALKNDFPVVYRIDYQNGKEDRLTAKTMEELIDKSDALISEKEKLVKNLDIKL